MEHIIRVQPTFGSGLNSGVKRRLNPVRGAHVKGVKWVERGFNPLLWCPCERGGGTHMNQPGKYQQIQSCSFQIEDSLVSGILELIHLLSHFGQGLPDDRVQALAQAPG